MSWEDILKSDADREKAEHMWRVYLTLKERAKLGWGIDARHTLRSWQHNGLPLNPSEEEFIQWSIENQNKPIEKEPFTTHPAWDVYEY